TLPALAMPASAAILGEPTDLGLYYGHEGWMDIEVIVEGADHFHVQDAAQCIWEQLQASEEGNQRKQVGMPPRFAIDRGLRQAVIPVERRVRWEDAAEGEIARLRQQALRAVGTAGDIAVTVEVKKEKQQTYTGMLATVERVVNSWQTDPFHPLIERSRHALAAAGCAVKPGKWALGRLGMGTAGGVLLQKYKVPTIGYGPGHEEQAHAVDESVSLDNLFTCMYGTAAIAQSLIGAAVYGWTSDEI
ncbi:MAG: hypothetical protein N3A66_08960, partial [Planctomycetota bacterium]|nr:hypothetical protein [Planctomycetota bacterium]